MVTADSPHLSHRLIKDAHVFHCEGVNFQNGLFCFFIMIMSSPFALFSVVEDRFYSVFFMRGIDLILSGY